MPQRRCRVSIGVNANLAHGAAGPALRIVAQRSGATGAVSLRRREGYVDQTDGRNRAGAFISYTRRPVSVVSSVTSPSDCFFFYGDLALKLAASWAPARSR